MRWKYLKHQYRKEFKEQPIFRSGTDADVWISLWPYYNLMTFIKHEVMHIPPTGNLSVNQTVCSQEIEDIENSEMQNDLDYS